MSQSRLHEPLTQVERWCQEGEALPEKALETLLLLEVFRDGLGYSKRNAVAQGGADPKHKGVTDITLKLALKEKSKWIVVEIKRPGRDLRDRAVQQAGGYLVKLGATRGIVTDGRTWLFIRSKLKPRATRQYFIEVLLRLELSDTRQRRILEAALARCGRGTARRFFAMLETLRDLGHDEIEAATDGPRSQRTTALLRAMRPITQQPMARNDLSVLRLICWSQDTLVHCVLDEYKRKPVTVKKK